MSRIKEYQERIKRENTMAFRRSLARRIDDGETVLAGESYIYLDANSNVAERRATQADIEVAIERG